MFLNAINNANLRVAEHKILFAKKVTEIKIVF